MSKIIFLQDLPLLPPRGGGQQSDWSMFQEGTRRGHDIHLMHPQTFSQAEVEWADFAILSNCVSFPEEILRAVMQKPYMLFHHDYWVCRFRSYFPLLNKCFKCRRLPFWKDLYLHAKLNIFLSPLHYEMHACLIPELASHPHLEVPSPVDVTLFKPVEGVERKPNTVLWVGPFTEYVGIKYALAYAQTKPEYKYTFVGDDAGGIEQPWKEKIQTLGYKVLPYMPNEALPRLYSSFEYFLQLPSGPMPCMGGRVKIAAENGFKAIKDIRVGDRVWTHTGRLEKVLRTFKRPYQGKMVHIFLGISTRKKFRSIALTPEHPVLTDSRGWISAENLTVNDKILCLAGRCKVCGKPIHFDNSYCSERCSFKANEKPRLNQYRKRILQKYKNHLPLILPDLEMGRLAGMIDGEGSIYIKECKRDRDFVAEVHVSSSNKAILNHLRKATRLGRVYVAYDRSKPSYCKTNYRWMISQGPQIKALLEAIVPHLIIKKKQAELVLKMLNKKIRTYMNEASIDEFKKTQKDCRTNILRINKRTWTNRRAISRLSPDGGSIEFLPIKIRKILVKDKQRVDSVYNLEVQQDNSYIASSIAVHNCQRVAIEAYLCGTKIIANRNLGFASWNFKDREECREAVATSSKRFWDEVEKHV